MKQLTTSFAVASVMMLAQVNTHAFGEFLTAASVVPAADTDQTVEDFFDLNDDHRISYDEFVHSMAVKAMREMDSDKDGLLSPAEAAGSGAKAHAHIPPIDSSKADANGDDQVSIDELEQAIRTHTGVHALFRKLDKDGDDFLSESELKSIHDVPLIHLKF
jgi:Ca2+-binding EF-hand superfamily protein